MAELRHERIRCSSEQHRDDCAAPPRAVRLDGGLAGQRLHRLGEERRCEQQLHHGHERCDCREHGDQYERLLRHGDLICRRERQIKADGIGEPCQRRGETMRVVGRKTVVGVQQLHAAGGAVFEASIGRVPRGLVRGAAEEFRAQIAFQQLVVHDVFVVAEIAEFIVFCLQEQDVVEAVFGVYSLYMRSPTSVSIYPSVTAMVPFPRWMRSAANMQPKTIASSKTSASAAFFRECFIISLLTEKQ